GEPHARALPGVRVHRLPGAPSAVESFGLEFVERIEERSRNASDDFIAVYFLDELIERPHLAAQAKFKTNVMPAVEADADHRVHRAPLAARLDEDAAELRARGDEVVRPLESRLNRAEGVQRARHGHPCDERQACRLA